MFKLNSDKAKGFTIGVVFTLLLTTAVGTVFAAGKLINIKVSKGGIELYVDEKLFIPTDANGNKVEPFIYDGTTYLPVRAISTALNKDVKWDGKKSAIYIGKAPVAAQTDLANIKQYEGTNYIRTGQYAKFNILDQVITPFNRFDRGGGTAIYLLKSNYSELKGKFIVPYTRVGSKEKGGVSFYNVDKKGNETLISAYSAEAGDDPVDISVDLQGVDTLKIYLINKEKEVYEFDGVLYNVTLSGM